MSTIVLLDKVTTQVTGNPQNVQALRIPTDNKTFQATCTSSGSGSAVVLVEVSNNNVNWITMGTITVSFPTTTPTDGFVSSANWTYVRGRIDSITNATVSLFMGL
jgi:hypothetical protein